MPLLSVKERQQLMHYIDMQIQADINSRSKKTDGPQRLQNAEHRKDRNDGAHFILRKLLELNLNTSINNLNYLDSFTAQEQEAYPSIYVECILIRAFPELFYANEEDLTVQVDNEMIRAALGFDLTNEQNKEELNIKNFRTPILANLYSLDGNILWMVLQSIKPIADDFLPEDKINCYIELAHAFYRDGMPQIYK